MLSGVRLFKLCLCHCHHSHKALLESDLRIFVVFLNMNFARQEAFLKIYFSDD